MGLLIPELPISFELVILLTTLYITLYLILNHIAPRPLPPILPQERQFYSPTTRKYYSFNSIHDFVNTTQKESDNGVYVSIIVPAYNEEKRLGEMLKVTVDYLDSRLSGFNNISVNNITTRTKSSKRPTRKSTTSSSDSDDIIPGVIPNKKISTRSSSRNKSPSPSPQRDSQTEPFSYEIIVIDDGSKDSTTKIAHNFSVANNLDDPTGSSGRCLRVLKLAKNRGKGGAVRQGMMVARGKYVLFADADAASEIRDVEKLEMEIGKLVRDTGNSAAVAIGSRAHLVGTEAVVKRSFLRNFLMYSFHTLVYILGIRGIRDTQCGFKLFTREAASKIFPNVHVEGWIFDIEVLILATKLGAPIKETRITWCEMDGSKMNLMVDSFRMLKDLVLIRLCYALGIWKVGMVKKDV